MIKELIGSHITIIDSKNKSLINIDGMVVDETRNTITIKTNKGEKKLIKNSIKIEMLVDNKMIGIDGKKLVGRPEDRIKK